MTCERKKWKGEKKKGGRERRREEREKGREVEEDAEGKRGIEKERERGDRDKEEGNLSLFHPVSYRSSTARPSLKKLEPGQVSIHFFQMDYCYTMSKVELWIRNKLV